MHNENDMKNKPLIPEIEALKDRIKVLEISEQRFRATIQSIVDGMISTDAEGNVLQVNPRAETLTGWSERESTGRPITDIFRIIDDKTGEQIENPLTRILDKKTVIEETNLLVTRDNIHIPITYSCALIFDSLDNIIGLVLIFNDNSEQYLLQKLIRTRLALLEYAASHSLDELLLRVLSEVGEFVDSPVCFYCFVEEDQKTISIQRLSITDSEKDIPHKSEKGHKVKQEKIWNDVILQKKPIVYNDLHSQIQNVDDDIDHSITMKREIVVPVIRKNKVMAILGVGNKQNEYGDKDIEIVSYMADVTWQLIEYKRIDKALQESEKMYRNLSEEMPVFICTFQKDSTLTYVNKAFADYLHNKAESLVGRRFFDFIPDYEIKRIKSIYQSLTTVNPSQTYSHQAIIDNHKVWHQWTGRALFNDMGNVIGFQAIGFDITEQKQVQEEKEKLQGQLIQAQKMESVGRLAGGIAHDFNNMLSVIMGEAEMIMMEIDSSHPHYNNLKDIRKAAIRSADLTRQLLAFARKQVIAPKVLNLNDTIEGMLKMLRRLIGEDIELEWIPGDEVWPVKVDPGQIDQILANLCVNARDAIQKEGRIIIETNKVSLDMDYCFDHPGLTTGDYVYLSVSDNGCGMNTETLDRIFEPFFTTKIIGKGTGLGLATVYGIVKQNNGYIDVQSEHGKGSSFKVYLPKFSGEELNNTKQKKLLNTTSGSEKILLVEDDPGHLKTCAKILDTLGYNVICARLPFEAIELAKTNIGIELIVTDLVMPQMNGRELANRIESLVPNIKKLFMSGYPSDVIIDQRMVDEHMIQKPFFMDDLAVKVREVLENG